MHGELGGADAALVVAVVPALRDIHGDGRGPLAVDDIDVPEIPSVEVVVIEIEVRRDLARVAVRHVELLHLDASELGPCIRAVAEPDGGAPPALLVEHDRPVVVGPDDTVGPLLRDLILTGALRILEVVPGVFHRIPVLFDRIDLHADPHGVRPRFGRFAFLVIPEFPHIDKDRMRLRFRRGRMGGG